MLNHQGTEKSPHVNQQLNAQRTEKKSKFLQAAVIQSRLQTSVNKNIILDYQNAKNYTQSPNRKLSAISRQQMSDQDITQGYKGQKNPKNLRQQLGVNPFQQDQDIYQNGAQLAEISQSFSNQTLGPSQEKKHNFVGGLVHEYNQNQQENLEDETRFRMDLKNALQRNPKKQTEELQLHVELSPNQNQHQSQFFAQDQKKEESVYGNQHEKQKFKQSQRTPQKREYKNAGGYIDSIHDLCLHSAKKNQADDKNKPLLRQRSSSRNQVVAKSKHKKNKEQQRRSNLNYQQITNENLSSRLDREMKRGKSATSIMQESRVSTSTNMNMSNGPNQSYSIPFQNMGSPFVGAGLGQTTTQFGGVNLVLPIQQFSQQHQPNGYLNPPAHSNQHQIGLPSNEFLSLKEISQHLGQKIDLIQNQINKISSKNQPQGFENEVQSYFSEQSQDSDQEFRRKKKHNGIKLNNKLKTVKREQECQTEKDEGARQNFEEVHQYKFQTFKLKEQIKNMEERQLRDHELHKDKIQTLQSHISMLEEDNQRLAESIKAKKVQVQGAITAQIKVKDSLIEELTSKLKESTKVIQHIKSQQKKLQEDFQNSQSNSSATFESQLAEARKQIEEQLSKQLNSTISEQLSQQFEQKLNEAKNKSTADSQKYKKLLAEKEKEFQQQILAMSENHEMALKATEDAIKEAKKAVDSRKNLRSETEQQIQEKLLADFKIKLAEAEAQTQKKDTQIKELKVQKQNLKDNQDEVNRLQNLLKTTQNEKKEAIKQLQIVEQKQNAQQLILTELEQIKQASHLKDENIKELLAKIAEIDADRNKKDIKLKALISEGNIIRQQHARQIENAKNNQGEAEQMLLQQLQDTQQKYEGIELQLKRAKENVILLESQLANSIDQKSSDEGMVQQITKQFQLKLEQADAELIQIKKSQQDAQNKALDKEKQLQSEIDKLKTMQSNDKTEIEKLKESKKDLSLKIAQAQKEQLLKKKEDEKSKKSVQQELEQTLEQLQASKVVAQALQNDLKEKEKEVEECEREHLEQLNYINQIKQQETVYKGTINDQATQILELSKQLGEIKQKESKDSQHKKESETQLQQALQITSQKASESAAEVSQLKQEIEKIKAEQRKSEEEITETFMAELKEVETKLQEKTEEAVYHAKECSKYAQEIKNSEHKVLSLQQALNETINAKSGMIDGHEKKIQEQLNQILKLKNEADNSNHLVQTQATQILELKNQLEQLKQKDQKESQQNQETETQMQMALQATFQKNAESAAQVVQLKQEIEKIKAEQKKRIEEQKKSEEEITETFMAELKEVETNLQEKTEEVAKHAKEVSRYAVEIKNSEQKIISLQHALNEAVKAKTEAEELTEITIQKEKENYEKRIANLQQELDQAHQMKKDSSQKRIEITDQKGKEVEKLKGVLTQQQDGTAQILMKFQEELSTKDKQITEAQSMNKKLIQQMAKLQDKSTDEIDVLQKEMKKLNLLIKQHEQEKVRFNDMENELEQVKSQISLKENEIQRLKFKLSSQSSEENELAALDSGHSSFNQSSDTRRSSLKPASSSNESQNVKNLQFEIQTLSSQVQEQEQELESLQDQNDQLQKELDELKDVKSNKNQSSLEDEIKRQVQILMVKESELESLRKQNKQMKETIANNDSSSQIQELSKKVAFSVQEKQMNTMLIEQLSAEITQKDLQLQNQITQGKQLTETVQKLSMQIATLSMQAMTSGQK